MRRIIARLLTALVTTGIAGSGLAAGWKTVGVSVLPDITLEDFVASTLGVTVDDHGIRLGGIGSDLWHGPGDGPGVYWMITDRGPNGQIRVGTSNRRTFPVPEFTPTILRVRTVDGRIEILDVIPIRGTNGEPVTGLSNAARDEVPFDCSAQTPLARNPHGLDSEGLVRMVDGSFWVAEEYGPSLLHVAPDGRVIRRYQPIGLPADTATPQYESVAVFPEIYGTTRKGNRGFEGLALSPDGHTLYIALQSPLSNPTRAIGDASRNTRILAFDTRTELVTGEFVYRFQRVTEFGLADPSEMKVSAIAMLDQHQMLVLERVDQQAKIYRVDLRTATDIFRSGFDTTGSGLESLDAPGLAAAGVDPLSKDLVIDLDSRGGLYPAKIEGLTVIDGRTIAIANDNDFGIGTFNLAGGGCTLVDSGVRSTIQVILLDEPLKK